MPTRAPHAIPTVSGWRIAPAEGLARRARGLLGRRSLDPEEGLWLPVRSVHTLGMRLHLDLVWLGPGGRVVRLDRDVPPGRVRSCRVACGGVVEVLAGRGPTLVRAIGPTRGAQASSS